MLMALAAFLTLVRDQTTHSKTAGRGGAAGLVVAGGYDSEYGLSDMSKRTGRGKFNTQT